MRSTLSKAVFSLAAWLVCCAGLLRADSPPANDAFASATVMSGQFWFTQGSLYGATSESNEPILTGDPNGPTIWYRWTAPVSGGYRVSTFGSENVTIVAVYTGATLDATRLVAYQAIDDSFTNAAAVGFTATAGQTYSFQVLGADYSSPTFISDPFLPSRIQISLTPTIGGAFVAPNDNFANATVLTGSTADVVVDDATGTSETGEPGGFADARGNTVWLAWTAPSTGVWQIDTTQGDHDTITAVYTGSAVNALTLADYSDDDSSPNSSGVRGGRVTIRATSGVTYHIQIQGASLGGSPPDYGCVRVMLQPVQPPANDDFANPIILTGNKPNGDGWLTFATREAGEPAAPVDESRSGWWQWTAPTSGVLGVVSYQGSVDVFTGSSLATLTPLPYDPKSSNRPGLGGVTYWYTVTAGTVLRLRGRDDHASFSMLIGQSPANDDFANRKTLTGATTTDSVDMSFATWETTETGVDSFGPPSVWYRWVAPSTGRFVIDTKGVKFTRLGVYTGTTLSNLVSVGDESIYGYDPNSYDRIYLDATSGTEYSIALKSASAAPGLDRINIRPFSPPANDNFASAVSMTGSAWATTGSDVDATSETGEPFISFNSGVADGKSVWWKWTAPAGGLFRVSTAGSAVDTILGVYTGSSVSTLNNIGKDGDSGFGATSALVFKAVSGTTYYFTVDTQNRQEGALKLALQPITAQPNDNFANRLLLSGLSLQASGNVIGATTEAGEPNLPKATVGHSVWFEWVAPASGTAIFNVTTSNFYPAVGIFSGTALNNLSSLLTNDGGAATSAAQTYQTSYPVNSGSSYKILIDGSPATNGTFQLSITLPSAPVNDAFESRYPLTGPIVHSSGNNRGATRQSGEPAHAGVTATASIWWEWTAPSSGAVTIDTANSVARPALAVYTGTAANALTAVASDTTVSPETFSMVTFTAVAGTKYEIAADTGFTQPGDIALNIVMASSVLANDAFASAAIWNGDQQEALFYPQGATAETGEPAFSSRPAARSMWWKWTPATARRASIWMETQSTTLLSRMVVYRGDALNNLTVILSEGADVHWQRSQLDVLAGVTYYIVIDTPSGPVDPGWIKMGIEPVNGTSSYPALVTPDAGSITESTIGASTANTQVSPSSQRQLWFAWTAPVNARMDWHVVTAAGSGTTTTVGSDSGFSHGGVTVPVPGSNELLTTFDALAGATYFFQVTTLSPVPVSVQLTTAIRQVPPTNDLQNRALPMAGSSWTYPLTLGAESGNTLYWNWVAPTTGVAQITLSGALASTDALLAYADGLTPITAGASSTNGGPPVIRLASKAGQHWLIVTRTDFKRLRAATLALVPAPGAIPANDSYLTPQVLSTNWTSVTGDVTYASCEPGERDHSGRSGTGNAATFPPGRSVWFDWTPTVTGPITLRLDSAANLAMQLYSGSTLQQWSDGYSLSSGSHILNTTVNAGLTYHIAVATLPYDEVTSAFTLSLGSAAPNDSLANAIPLTGAATTSTVDSTGATVEAGEIGNGFDFANIYGSLWWTWTAPSTGIVRMDTLGSEYDTVLAVFSSNPPDNTTRVAENDNATARAGVTTSAVNFTATAGKSYLIRIDHQFPIGPNLTPLVSDITGMAKLNISMSAPLDPFPRWVADRPALTGNAALETADPDADGVPNLLELAFGSNPKLSDATHSRIRYFPVDGGWQAEATLDRNSLEALYGGTPLEVSWQISKDLVTWSPGPISQFVRMDGVYSVERIVLQPGEGPYVRLVVRDPR